MDQAKLKFFRESRKFMADFLVIGSGSAGRRHSLCLRQLYPQSSITILKRSSSTQPLELLSGASIKIVSQRDEIEHKEYALVAIASPAPMHLDDATWISTFSKRILIEKPITQTSWQAIELISALRNTCADAVIGYHLRFSPTVTSFAHIVRSTGREKLLGLKFHYGQHIRHWRPKIDPRTSVTTRKELGGGVLRELSHEIDAAGFIVGWPQKVLWAKLEFDGAPTDGIVETSANFALDCSGCVSEIHLDMTSDVPSRIWEAIFEDFKIEADLIHGYVTQIWRNGDHKILTRPYPNERDHAAKLLLNAAINPSTNPRTEPCTVDQASWTIKTIEAVELSALTGEVIVIGM